MILGLGSDIVDIRRLERLYREHGESLRRLLFTDNEWKTSSTKDSQVAFLAKRFAAKEAFIKALGVGFGQDGNALWRDIEVTNNALGQPNISLSGNVLAYINKVLEKYGMNRYSIYLSLSDEFPYALANVVISLDKKVMEKDKKNGNWLKEAKSIVGILLLVLVFRTFVYEIFQIPSSSMVPSLLIGDMPVVEKWAYGYSKHSILLSPPLFKGRILKGRPKRGEVVVFKLPSDPSTNYIKRVIGLPGDRIQVKNGILHINDVPAKLTYKGEYIFEDEIFNGKKCLTHLYTEVLPGAEDKPHTIIRFDINNISEMNNTPVYTVPENHYFMMGDNRDFSLDSRVLNKVGYVHEDYLVGRAVCTLYSITNKVRLWEFWRWLQNIRYGRILRAIE